MKIKNIFTELENSLMDNKAGIRLIKLTGDKEISVYAADIAPKTELRPHYHKLGIETYQILQGEGVMKIGNLENDKVTWIDIFTAKAGDCFSIEEGLIHQIINESEKELLVVFSCPESHVGDDRFFVDIN